MGSSDNILKTLREMQKIIAPLQDFEQLYGRGYQRAIREQLRSEAMLKASLPTISGTGLHALESMRQAASLARAIERHSDAATNIIRANRGLSEQLCALSQQSEIQRAAASLGSSWERTISLYKGLSRAQAASELALQTHYTSIAETVMLAQQRLLSVPWNTLNSTAGLKPADLFSARQSFTKLTGVYESLVDSFSEHGNFIASFPPIVSSGPPAEMLTSVGVLNSISREPEGDEDNDVVDALEDDIRVEIVESLDELLLELDPNLRSMWLGAKESLWSDNSDRARHVLFSLRELVTQTLHLVAPKEAVTGWTSDPAHFHNESPTRRARILYVCRNINHDPFSAFIDADVKAGIELITLFQRGHQMAIPFSDVQLATLVIRAESLLRLLLLVSGVKT